MRMEFEFGRNDLFETQFNFEGVLPGARGMRFESRKIWVSTAIRGSANAIFMTTLAVLRPTPGNVSSSSRLRGISPPNSLTSLSLKARTFFALVRKSPMVRIMSRILSSPRAAIFAGVSAAANSAAVALLTPASVACADRTTATSNVKELR